MPNESEVQQSTISLHHFARRTRKAMKLSGANGLSPNRCFAVLYDEELEMLIALYEKAGVRRDK
jgi:hypothetical protein